MSAGGARKTFYANDQFNKKATREWGVNNGTAAGYQQIPMSRGRIIDPIAAAGENSAEKMFHKPRALSRQTDAHIRIEVHRDETIINHLQRE